MIRLTLALLLALLAAAAPAAAQVSMAKVLRSVYALHGYGGVELSPSGDEVAWDDSFHPGPAPEKARGRSALYVLRLAANAAPVRVTAGKPEGTRSALYCRRGRSTRAPMAVLYIAHAHRKAGALAAGARDVGVTGATVDVRTGTLHDKYLGA